MNIKLPKVKELTEEQQNILDEIKPVAIYGGAGTGKTILSIWKHILNWEKRRIKSYLITYTHSLTKYFEMTIKEESPKASRHIQNIDKFKNNNNNIDMLIVDEAQDIDITKHSEFKKKYKSVSYGADDNQILYPENSSTEKKLNNLYENREFTLTQNFRNSYEILNFINYVFPNSNISEKMLQYSKENYRTYKKPIFNYSNNQKKLDLSIVNFLNSLINDDNNKVAILVPTIKMFDIYKSFLSLQKVDFSYYNNEQKGDIRYKKVKNIHLTTFKSSKGLEFDIVIIPNIQDIDYWRSKPKSSTINENDYYVGMTRAREKLILLSNKKDLFNIDSDLYETKDI